MSKELSDGAYIRAMAIDMESISTEEGTRRLMDIADRLEGMDKYTAETKTLDEIKAALDSGGNIDRVALINILMGRSPND